MLALLARAAGRDAPAAAHTVWCRALSATAAARHSHSHGGVPCSGHGHSHSHTPFGPTGPDESGTLEDPSVDDEPMITPADPPGEDTGLPVEQRAKNILASNWRGQLSTVEVFLGNSKQPRKPAVHGSLAPFALLPDGEAVVFLAEADAHVQNLAANALASLTVGATDPPSLVAALRDGGGRCVLPRVSLLGQLHRLPDGDAAYATRRAAAAHAAATANRPPAATLEGMRPYRFSAEDVRWVDVRGGQHPVATDALAGALVDPFASGFAALLAKLNGAADAAAVHAALCRAYLGVDVSEAHLFGVDRAGVSLLGRAARDAPWREFRFAFASEVKDGAALESALRDMAEEAREHLAGGGGA